MKSKIKKKTVKKVVMTPEDFFGVIERASEFIWDEEPCTIDEFLGALKDDMLIVLEDDDDAPPLSSFIDE
jgi:hypothetical protein